MKLQIKKKQHADYFRYITGNGKTTSITVSRHSDIGRLIYALAIPCDTPRKFTPDPGYVVIDFEFTSKEHIDLGVHYWYIPKWAQLKINDFLVAEFNLDRRYFMLIAHDLGIERKTAAEIFLASHNVSTDKHCSVIKSDLRYRDRIKDVIINYVQKYGYQHIKK